jgi:hypothetical protein
MSRRRESQQVERNGKSLIEALKFLRRQSTNKIGESGLWKTDQFIAMDACSRVSSPLQSQLRAERQGHRFENKQGHRSRSKTVNLRQPAGLQRQRPVTFWGLSRRGSQLDRIHRASRNHLERQDLFGLAIQTIRLAIDDLHIPGISHATFRLADQSSNSRFNEGRAIIVKRSCVLIDGG